MKSVILSLVAVAGLSVAANADVNTQFNILVSADGGPFLPAAALQAGTGLHNVEVVVQATYIGTGQALGFASAVFQPTVSNFGATDVALGYVNGGAGSNTSTPPGVVADAPGQYGRIVPFGRTALSTTTALTNFNNTDSGINYLRIAQRTATSFIGGTGNTTGGQGVPVAQLANVGRTASDPAFNPAVVGVSLFRFGMTIDTNTGSRVLTIDLPLNAFGNRNTTTGDREVYWWGDLNANTGDLRGTAAVAQGAISVIVPTPGSLALLGLGGLCVARRRR